MVGIFIVYLQDGMLDLNMIWIHLKYIQYIFFLLDIFMFMCRWNNVDKINNNTFLIYKVSKNEILTKKALIIQHKIM